MATATEENGKSNRNRVLLFVEVVAAALFLAFFVDLLMVSQLGFNPLFSNVQQYLLLLVMSFLIAGDLIAKQIISH